MEQTFAKWKLTQGEHRGEMNDGTINDELHLYADEHTPAEIDQVIKDAQIEWSAVYGCARSNLGDRADRLDKGKTRKSKSNTSEAAWIKNRRDRMIECLTSPTAPGANTIEVNRKAKLLAKQTMGKGHHDEIKFQNNKRLVNLSAAAQSHHALPGEISRPVRAKLRDITLKVAAARKRYDAKSKKRRSALIPCKPVLLPTGANVFVDCKFQITLQELNAGILKHSLHRVWDRHRAKVFIVDQVRH